MSSGPSTNPTNYRFGNFEASLSAGELLRKGVRVKLQEQPFQLLMLLLENAGEIVSRENVRQRLWPGNTFVEFDASLSVAVGKLRDALGDAADNPRFIETIPRKGYRFVAPVERFAQPRIAADPPSYTADQNEGRAYPREATTPIPQSPSGSLTFTRALAISVVALALAGAFVFHTLHRNTATTAQAGTSLPTVQVRRSVAVLGFRNLPGRKDDDWLSQAFTEMLSTELAAGGGLRIVSDEDVARCKRELSLGNEETLAKSTLERMHGNPGADVVLIGAYTPLPGKDRERIRLDLRLQDTSNGETIAEDAVTGSKEDLFEIATRAGDHLRKSLGVRDLSLDAVNSVRASLPSNQDAVRFYSEGRAKLWVFDFVAARDLLNKAVSADPDFPLAHSALSDAWWYLGYLVKARAEAKRAIDLSANLPVEERLRIQASYQGTIGDWPKAVETYRALFLLHPDSLEYGLSLAGAQYHVKAAEALATLRALRQLPPPAGVDPRIDLLEASAEVGQDLAAGQAAAHLAIGKGKAQGSALMVARAYGILCQQASSVGTSTQEAVANCENARRGYALSGDHFNEARTLNDFAGIYFQRGDLSKAASMWREAEAVFRQLGDHAGLAVTSNNIGDVLLLEGNLAEANKLLGQALTSYRAVEDKDGMALVLNDLGEIALRRGSLENAEKKYREAKLVASEIADKSVVAYGLSGLGEVAMDHGDLSSAREFYEESLALRTQLGEKQTAAQTRVALAKLSIQGEHASDVGTALRKCKEQFHEEGQADDEIMASIGLAEFLLADGKLTDAQNEMQSVEPLARKSQNRLTRMQFKLTSARVQIAGGHLDPSRIELERLLLEARQMGFLESELEIRLVQAELLEKSGRTAQARDLLQALQRDAHSRGFDLIAHEASASSSNSHRYSN